MFRHARARLTLWYGVVFFAVLVVLGAATYVGLTRSIDQQVDRGIAAAVTQWIETAPDPRTLTPLPRSQDEGHGTTDVFILVYRSDGALVANPRQAAGEELIEHAIGDPLAAVPVWRTVALEHERLRIQTVPVEIGGTRVGVVIGGRNLAERDLQIQTVIVVLGAVAGAGLLLAVSGGYLLAGRALRPLAAAYEGQRRFVGDASHELRSPITVIRTTADLLLRGERLDGAEREAVADIRDVADEAARLVEDLLDLARMEQRADASTLPPGGADLARIAARELDRLEPQCLSHRTTVTRDLASTRTAVTDDEAGRVLRALIENVLQHTPVGTPCAVSTRRDGNQGVLSVEDSGPGVPENARLSIFDRFSRVETAHTPGTGSGLGLAIVRTIATRREGSAAASTGKTGGLRIEVRFPEV